LKPIASTRISIFNIQSPSQTSLAQLLKMAARHPVGLLSDSEKTACTALSWLFLDTEATPNEIDDIVNTLRPLDISIDALDNIFRHDVFPILYPNLLSTAGVWEGFDQEWLLRQVETRRAESDADWVRIRGVRDSVVWFMVGRMVVSSWDQVKETLRRGQP